MKTLKKLSAEYLSEIIAGMRDSYSVEQAEEIQNHIHSLEAEIKELTNNESNHDFGVLLFKRDREIEQLSADNARLRAALQPFSDACNEAIESASEGAGIYTYEEAGNRKNNRRILATDLVAAKQALTSTSDEALSAIRETIAAMQNCEDGANYSEACDCSDALNKLKSLFGSQK